MGNIEYSKENNVKRLNEYLEELKGCFSEDAYKKIVNYIMNTKESEKFPKCCLYLYAPASSNFHSNFEGGLLEHSLRVTDKLVQFTKDNNLTWSRKESPIIIGLFHDLCKTYDYGTYNRNVKDENGKWNQVECFKTNDLFPLGVHGDKSIIILQRLVGDELTLEEIMAIRYHMGYSEGQNVFAAFGEAKKQFPNILWVNLADDLSSVEEKVISY